MRVGFLLKVKKEMILEYKRRHENVWPEMLSALNRNGWWNYSLFLSKDGLLFGYFETPVSLEEANSKMSLEEINTKWQTDMTPFFEAPDGSKPDEVMVELDEVFFVK